MRQIIKGKKYDTDTARILCSRWNGLPMRDFDYCEETLYKKENGEYFVHGSGGAMTRYAERCGRNCWAGGSAIIPLTRSQAMDFAEMNMDIDEYEEEFGETNE